MNSIQPIFVVGSTAVGKSAVALELAEQLGGEIISVDSMQVYRGLDIGTAKPTAAERQRVAHYLIDVAALTDPFDAAAFVRLAGAAEREIAGRGRVPIFCGGTGLYFKAYLEGLGEAPPANPEVRAALESTPLEELLRELKEKDATTYERIDRQNPRRVIRALEVIRVTGRPFSEQRAEWAPAEGPNRPRYFMVGLQRPAGELHRRIEHRVEAMFAQGLVAETRGLPELEQNRTAMQAIGYRQVVEHLRGERSLPETVELVKIRTRQYAKRQLTWFRRQLAVDWLAVNETHATGEIVERIKHRRSVWSADR
jgi:tRNA dimethylallyltransferase